MNTQEWLAKLVSFDTTSRHSNLELIATIMDELADRGIAARLTHDPSGKKANLFATLPAEDGTENGGIILSGHTDVVPVDGQQWDTNPRDFIRQLEFFIEDELLPKMRVEHVGASVEIDSIATAPSFEAEEQAAITALVRLLTKEQKRLKVAYATEAGLFQQAGIPTIVCGPGNIEQAHRANEYITLEQLRECENFLRALAVHPFLSTAFT